ncbi:AraC family transcriptional regulator [Alkalimarinus alittae]|uniref:AraC family transcriptional regulator n=1 Tax=Alkalimarinus alittae TaxID=2961619 RepID=A0ABY6N0Q1_9ALTE|nr:AraC family transcriptional regulator [Alkalimarinus alittae]UZE95587.1 AraC family transcriptional regulator [Alkalimarinus alittae]
MHDKEITVSLSWVKGLVTFAEQQGCERATLFKKSGLAIDALEKAQRLTMDETVNLWGACISETRDPFFGLHLGEQVRPSTFHIVGYTLMNSASLCEAFDKLNQYQRLISEGGVFQRVPSAKGVWLIYHPRPATIPFFYHQIDAVLTAFLAFSRWVTGKKIQPIEVSLNRVSVDSLDEYKRVFNVTPNFNAEFDGLLMTHDTMSLPLLEADEELREIHERHARQRLIALQKTKTTADQVSMILQTHMADSDAGRLFVAKKIGLNEKGLQRKLAEEGVTFQGLYNEIRKRLALDYVSDTGIPLAEVSIMLGFSDSSAFYRAFKRWTGCTPGNYRELSCR